MFKGKNMLNANISGDNYYKSYLSATKINLDKVESFRQIKCFIKQHFADKPASILDIGCGIGYLTNYLNQAGKAIGLDKNTDALEIARNLYPDITFISKNIISDKINETKFNVIVCNNIVEHLTEDERKKLFLGIKRLLTDNGIIIFGYANPFHPVQLVWGFLTKKVLFDKTHIYNWSITEFYKTVADEFNILEVKKTSPFTKMACIGKYFKGDIIILANMK